MFHRLPIEIRLNIYEELLLSEHTIFISSAKEHTHDQGVLASLLLVNKNTRDEVLDWLKKTNIRHQNGISPDIKIKSFSIFNPAATTFRIVTARSGKPVVQDFKMSSLWHVLAILFQCDSNHQVKLRSYDSKPSNAEIEVQFDSWENDNYSWSDICPNWVQLSQMLYASFNAEFGYDIKFQYLIPRYYDSCLDDQLVRIPFAYHRALSCQNLDYNEIIKQVCELQDELRVEEPNDPFDAFYFIGDADYQYSGEDKKACLDWSFFDFRWPAREWSLDLHDY
ncbi:hypothetical protein IFR05_012546 [Cadophora sp. M221]|nr:hypothetical protein IFR05_012546 [Cadophora sp. M221]